MMSLGPLRTGQFMRGRLHACHWQCSGLEPRKKQCVSLLCCGERESVLVDRDFARRHANALFKHANVCVHHGEVEFALGWFQ